jgi:peptidoglycan/xylan/chitin deacetylase (PgdA/CDA1 family)
VKIFLTFDYELFFGTSSGSVGKCMLEPTSDLLALAKGKDVKYTFFVDVGYLIQAEKFPETISELNQVKHQIKEILVLGHDVQLHVHPHWEKSSYVEGKWKMNTSGAYKLSDFDAIEQVNIIKKYKSYLELLIGKEVTAYRAGGWCIQPFQEIKQVFKEVGLKIDSSVFSGGYLVTDDYYVDFTAAPRKSCYRFEEDVCVEDRNGSFIEYPISSYRYRPSFFWMLYVLGRLFPAKHKMIGDGVFISQGGRKRTVLTSYTNSHVSTDGYYAKKLNAALEKSINLKHEEMVVIGHPKGNTVYSMDKLAQFINVNYKKHEFTSFDKEL